jgi:hypothetical protein
VAARTVSLRIAVLSDKNYRFYNGTRQEEKTGKSMPENGKITCTKISRPGKSPARHRNQR